MTYISRTNRYCLYKSVVTCLDFYVVLHFMTYCVFCHIIGNTDSLRSKYTIYLHAPYIKVQCNVERFATLCSDSMSILCFRINKRKYNTSFKIQNAQNVIPSNVLLDHDAS